jgi:hypothetical protein
VFWVITQPVGPILKGQAAQEEGGWTIFEDLRGDSEFFKTYFRLSVESSEELFDAVEHSLQKVTQISENMPQNETYGS